jgi:uncharacterized protein YcgL (UPF0745 family)
MKFVVYRCSKAPDYFIVTDEEHRDRVPEAACPDGGKLEEVGRFPEMGDERAAFNETIAKNSIREQGFYRIEAKSFDPVAQRPDSMPG